MIKEKIEELVTEVQEDKIPLSELEKKWLNAMGGRDYAHVLFDLEEKKYILMGTRGRGEERVYIPSEEEIQEFFNEKE